jgi:hypothetical protein
MTSPLRVKIEYCDSNEKDTPPLKLIYLITSPSTTTISKLISILQESIVTQFSRQNIHLVHLTTDDGYLLMKNYLCSDTLISNEKLVCIDMNQFVRANANTLNIKEAWFRLERHDSTDNIEKSLNVGINNTGKFYIYLYGGGKNREIYLFNVIELLAIAHDKEVNQLKMKVSETSSCDWFVEAKWKHDSASNNTLLLIGNLKTGDTTSIKTGTLRINLNESTKMIDNWEVIDLSNEVEDNNHISEQARLNQLKELIPSPKRTGPTLNTTITSGKLDTHECEGDSAILMMRGDESFVEISQEMYAHDGIFHNFINITHVIISKKPVILPEILTHKRSIPVDKPISIVRVNVQYQRHDGKWLDCSNAKIILATTQQNDKSRLATSILNIESDKLVSVSIETAIPVNGKPNRNNIARRRAHRSLPQPLKLKIIATDNLSKTCSLTVEQINEPLEFITREKFLERKKADIKKLIAFIYADDCDYDERIFMGIFIDNDDVLVIQNENRSMCKKSLKYVHFNGMPRKIKRQKNL